jgi:hypothetical protein
LFIGLVAVFLIIPNALFRTVNAAVLPGKYAADHCCSQSNDPMPDSKIANLSDSARPSAGRIAPASVAREKSGSEKWVREQLFLILETIVL